MDRIETTKLLPELIGCEQRKRLHLQGEFNGRRISLWALVDFEVASNRGKDTEAEDIIVCGVWSEDASSLIGDGDELSNYIEACAARAAADLVVNADLHHAACGPAFLKYAQPDGRKGRDYFGGADFAGNSHQMTILRPAGVRRAA